jgi:flagellar hook-associated protein 3 FlgL
MRITQATVADQLLFNLQQTQQSLLVTQEQLSAGRRILLPEDDPAGTARAMQLQQAIADTGQYLTNDAGARNWLQATDAALGEGTAVLQQVRTLAVQGASATNGPTDLATLAQTVAQLQGQLLTAANSQLDGQYLFAGQKVQAAAAPYALTASGVSYGGDGGALTAEIGPGVHMAYNVTSAQGVFTPALQAVGQVLADLQAGNAAAVGTVVTALDQALNGLQDARAEAGTALQRLTQNDQRLQSLQVNLQSLLANTQDLDVAGAIVRLQQEQVAYQQALAVGARLQQTTLLDYLHP